MSYTQYQQHGGNPYNNGPGAEAGRGGVNNNDLGHEMSGYSAPSQYSSHTGGYQASAAPSSTILSQPDFLARVDFSKSEIRALSSNIQEIAAQHQRALSSPDSTSSAQLEHLVTQTQLKNTQIRDQIKFLEADALKTQDGTKSTKTRQANQLKGEFEKALKEYQQEEVGYRQRYREQIARQYRIVNPEASDSEIREATEQDWSSEGVFQTALKSNRSGQASSVLGAVRARHSELQRIENNLIDLNAMFTDMAQIVEAQDPATEQMDTNAEATAEHVDRANEQLEKGKEHAWRRRRNQWWCLLIVVLIVLGLALGIGLGIGLSKATTKTATGQ